MDPNDSRQRAVFFEAHAGLPREGPGDRPSTARALDLARPLPAAPQVLDIACGPGAQTIDLAELLPQATITAVDLHEPFVAETNRRAASACVAGRVRAMVGDMTALAFPPASFDLLWCEGAAYIMGVGAALRAWRPLLRPGGRAALSEAVWLRHESARAGPAAVCRLSGDGRRRGRARPRAPLRLPAARRLRAAADGLDDRLLQPLRRRLAELAPRYEGDAVACAVLERTPRRSPSSSATASGMAICSW